jgi:hypothetical protein
LPCINKQTRKTSLSFWWQDHWPLFRSVIGETEAGIHLDHWPLFRSVRDSINFGKQYFLLLFKYISPFFFMCFKILFLCVMLFYFCFIFNDVYNFWESWFLLFELKIVFWFFSYKLHMLDLFWSIIISKENI